MTLPTFFLVLLIVIGIVAAAWSFTSDVINGDGLVGPGIGNQPPRSHHPDVFETSMRPLR